MASHSQRFAKLALMGGCGSSGTTLMVHLLSKHPDVGSGPEFNCFNHPELYNLDTLRRCWPKMNKGQCAPAGYIDVPVFLTYRQHFSITEKLVETWLQESNDACDFVAKISQHLQDLFCSPIILEKSPTNVYCFEHARTTLSGVKLIHMIRDGRDVVVSLMRRRFNLFGAGSRWLYDTLQGLGTRHYPGYIETRYEDIVADSQAELARIWQHLGVTNNSAESGNSRLEKKGLYVERWRERAVPQAWNQTPSDPISSRSIGQYRKVLSNSDLNLLYRIKMHASAAPGRDLPSTFGEMLEYLGYSLADQRTNEPVLWRPRLSIQATDFWRRFRRFESRRDFRIPRRLTSL